jgi:hypothetical protein
MEIDVKSERKNEEEDEMWMNEERCYRLLNKWREGKKIWISNFGSTLESENTWCVMSHDYLIDFEKVREMWLMKPNNRERKEKWTPTKINVRQKSVVCIVIMY